jgi:drug/metabolite transporter (DMT)-like permease
MVVAGFLMVYLNQMLVSEGLSRSTATNGSLIIALSPLVSASIAALVFGERVSMQRLFGIILGLGGVVAVILSHSGAGSARATSGDLMLIASVASFAFGGALVQRLSKFIDALTLSWFTYMAGTLMLIVQVLLTGQSISIERLFPGWWSWALIFFSGALANALGTLLWNSAIASIGVARTAVFLYWVPVFGMLFAVLLLNEPLTIWHFAGFAAVLCGTTLGSRGHA